MELNNKSLDDWSMNKKEWKLIYDRYNIYMVNNYYYCNC